MVNTNRAEGLKPHLSWSQIKAYMTCPAQYYQRYVLNLPQAPAYALCSGKAMHAGLEEHNRERARSRPGLKTGQVVDVAVAALDRMDEVTDLEIPKGQIRDALVQDITKPVGVYLEVTEPWDLERAAPATENDVERQVWLPIRNEELVGYVDLVLPELLIDYKLLGRAKSPQEIERDGQLFLYSQALKRPGAFVQLIRGTDRVVVARQNPTPAVARGLQQAIEDAVQGIQLGRQTGFWPRCNPTNWTCSSSSCAFFRRCFSQV